MLNDIEINVQKLHECLSIGSNQPENAQSLISEIVHICGEKINSQTIKFCLSIFFKREKSFLAFLRRTIGKDEYRACKVDILQFLNRFIIAANKLIIPFAVEIKDVCMIFFNSDKYSDVRCSTFPILSKILELSVENKEIVSKLGIKKIVTDFFQALQTASKLTASIKSLIFTQLGFICFHYPETMVSYSDKILGLFLDNLKLEMETKGRKPEFVVIAGILEGLNYYLNNFTHSAQEGAKYSFNIYKYCRDALLENTSDLNRYTMPKAALNLFVKHAEQFDEFIYDDYEQLFQRISNWAHHKNYDMKKLAYAALDPFYKQLAEIIRRKTRANEDEKKCKTIFAYFMKKFKDDLDAKDKNLKETAIAIKGYGAFARPCKQFLEVKTVKQMFVVIIERCENIFFTKQEDGPSQSTNEVFDEKIYQLPSFIESISYICNEIDDLLPEGSINTLEKLVILAIDNYPKLIKRYNRAISISLVRLLISIQLNKSVYYRDFTSKIIYQSLIRIFSYKTVYRVQFEQQQQIKDTYYTQKYQTDINTITSKDYVELWSNLLNLNQYEELNAAGINAEEKKKLMKIIYDEYMESIMKIINKLDLNAIKSVHDSLVAQNQSPTKQKQQGTEVNENNDFLSSNPLNNLKANRPRDFEILINLVEFTRDLLSNKHLKLFEKWLYKFSKEIIVLSSKYPFISGFYKLVTLCMRISIKIGYFNKIGKVESKEEDMDLDEIKNESSFNESMNENNDSSLKFERLSCFHLYKKYFKEVYIRMQQFKDELLASTLEFALSLPKELIEINLNEAFACLENALEIGIGYLPIAENALSSLEYWLNTIKLAKIKPYYPLILSKFDEYLELMESSKNSDENDGEINIGSKSKLLEVSHKGRGRKKITFKQSNKKASQSKNLDLSSLELSEDIQFRILKIFGQLAGQMSHYLHETTTRQLTKEIITWDTTLHIKFAMPFIDLKPTMYFDIFLPRVIHLALTSTNRQTKVNACELLHAIIVFMLGKSVTDPGMMSEHQKNEKMEILDRIYTNLYPAIFRLACDVDQFVRQLFNDLVMQMIHWFTGNRKYESKETIILLECIIECLVDEKNSSLRDFSALALREFLIWSIKRTPVSEQVSNSIDAKKSPINVKSILKRLYNLLTHPNSYKRLGGIVAWNSIYSKFREEEILVNLYSFELLYYFIECLAMCENDDAMYGTQEQAKLALDHIERIIREKHKLLSQPNSNRVKPMGWTVPVLDVAIRWLLRQCGRIETECRHKSMELVYKLAPFINGDKSPKDYFQAKFKSDGETYFLQRFEGGQQQSEISNAKNLLGDCPTLSDFIQKHTTDDKADTISQFVKTWMSMLIAPLDCYLWIFKVGLLSPQNLFSSNKTIIWKSIFYFLNNIALFDLHELNKQLSSNVSSKTIHSVDNEEINLFTPSEIEDYRRKKCTVIVRLIDFLTMMLKSQELIGIIPSEIWCEKLYKLILKTCLDPQSIGFNINDIEIYTNLPQLVYTFLKVFTQQVSNSAKLQKQKDHFQKTCQALIENDENLQIVNDLIALTSNNCEKSIDWFKLTQLVNGYEQLNEFGLYKFPTNLNRKLFNYLFETSTCSSFDVNVESSSVNRNEILTDNLTCLEAKTKLLNLIFNLNKIELKQPNALQGLQVVETDYMIEILDQYVFQRSESKEKINEFMHLYKNEIYSAIFISNDIYVKYLLNKLRINFKVILNIFISLIDYLNYYSNLDKQQRKLYSTKLSTSLYTSWSNINEYFFSSESNSINGNEEKVMVINLLIKLLVLDMPKDLKIQKNLFDFYLYLLDDHKTDLNFKCKILEILYFFSNLKPTSTNLIPSSSSGMASSATLEFDFSIKMSLERFVDNYFPLKSTELIETSAMYSDYTTAINKLLTSLELSLSFDLAQLIIKVYIREKQHICENVIKKTLVSYIKRLDNTSGSSALKSTSNLQLDLIQYYWNEWLSMSSIERMERKLTLFKNLLILFLENCNKQVFIEFICQNMTNIVNILESYELNLKLNTLGDLCDKRCLFDLIHLVYKRLSKDEIFSTNSKICQTYEILKFKGCKDGKEFTKEIIRKTRKYLCYSFENENENSCARLLHCSAYNCLAALFIRTQTEPKLYNACLFKDDLAKNEYIFEPLIDKTKTYKFNIELENLEQRRTQFVSLRNEFKDTHDMNVNPAYISSINTSTVGNATANEQHVTYLNTQNLYESSLSEELSAFDFTSNSHAKQLVASFQAPVSNAVTRKITASNYANGLLLGGFKSNENEIEFDLDELNQHESMITFIELIESLVKNKITPHYENDQLPTEMPPWMQFLSRKITDSDTHENVKLFLIRAIIITQNVFTKYAKFWYTPLISFLVNSTSLCTDDNIDFFTLDLVVLLLSWHKIGIPAQSDRSLVIKLFEKLMKNCYHDNRTILKNNLELLKTMTELWRPLINVPVGIIYNFLSNDDEKKIVAGIQIYGLALANHIQNYEYPSNVTAKHLYESLLKCCNSNNKKNIYTSAAEVIGMLLSDLKQKDQKSDMEFVLIKLTEALKSLETIEFITCIHRIQLNFKEISDKYIRKLVNCFAQLYGEPRLYCAESILSGIASLEDLIYKKPYFIEMLEQRNSSLQHVCLKIIYELISVNKIPASDTRTLLPILTNQFLSHPHIQCRYQLTQILISLFKMHSNTESVSEDSTFILKLCKNALLKVLLDKDSTIQWMAFNFWSEKAFLSENTIDRIVSVLDKMYASETELEFLSYSTNLLLEKTSKSPDYKRFIYDAPLMQCQFREYNLPIDWWRRHEVMTPLFAETLSAFDISIDGSINSQVHGETANSFQQLRATQQQSLQFQPTQETKGPYNWLTQSSLDTYQVNLMNSSLSESQTSLLFNTNKAVNVEDSDKDIFRLRRRFLREDKVASTKYYAMKQLKKNEREDEEKKQVKNKRAGQIEKYRAYRHGDFPDVQIKYFELIAPLQALAQRDPKIAISILSEINYLKDENQTNDIRNKIQFNLNNMLEKSESFNSNFIACIIEIANKHSNHFQLDTKLISSACLNSLQQTLGIILIEEYLIQNEMKTSVISAPTAKRIKLSRGKNTDEINLWIELAKLYRSISDYDSVKGIFTRNMNLMTDYTYKAFEHEANYDFYNARKSYEEAFEKDWGDNEPLEIEQELWEQSILRCCDELTDWKKMCDFSMNSTDLNELFTDSYTLENVFPYAFKSKLKLILQEDRDEQRKHQDLLDFIKNIDNNNKQFLEQKYCLELALIYLHQKDFHAAKYYAQLCIEQYLEDWSSINKTIIQARLIKLQSLQSITELNEFLKFIDSNELQQTNENLLLKNVQKLIELWVNTMPNSYSDPSHTWDDVITNRCIYLEFIEDKYLNDQIKMEISEDDDDALQLKRNRKSLLESIEETKISMKLQFADAARLQSNHHLALTKLQQTKFLIKSEQQKYNHLKTSWMHCYLRTHLSYSVKQFTSPSDRLINILDMSTLKRLVEYDSIAKDLRLKNRADLYRDQQIINSEFCKFILNAFLHIDNLNAFLSDLEANNGKLFNQLYSYVKHGTKVDINEKEFCTKPSLAANSILKCGFDSLNEISYDSKGSLEMAIYCDYFLRLIENADNEGNLLSNIKAIENEYPKVIIKQLLNAIRFESYEARQRFPRLIQIVELYPEAIELFVEESSTVPCWMFLGWTSQMTALLDKKEARAVHAIIQNISHHYPQALVYPFKMSLDGFKFDNTLKAEQEFVVKIQALMNRVILVDSLIEAFEHLTNPDLMCTDMLAFIKWNFKNQKVLMAEYREFYGKMFIESKSGHFGKIRLDFANQFKTVFDDELGVNGQLLKTFNETEIDTKITILNSKLKTHKARDGNIGDYSPWLKTFKRNTTFDLEIPGQYTGKKKPVLEYHVKIDSFDERVLSLNSLRKPKMITIRGNDEKEYKFMVKGGEDQRQDQRIELLFDFMNDLMRSDSQCYKRNLSIRTYQVIPMTKKVAIIEWINNTRTFKDVIRYALEQECNETSRRVDLMQKISQSYVNYITSATTYKKTQPISASEYYCNVFLNYKREHVSEKFEEIQNILPPDLFRRYIRSMSNSTEGYFLLRNQFIVSYAVVSICQYVLGIGDRHLNNMMIDTKTGQAVCIDFGQAFGHSTIQLSIPELMPIRLTRQLVKLNAPLEQNGVLEATMIHTLNALRENNDLLLCILDVFIKEPSIDWIGNAKRASKKNQLEDTDYHAGVSYAKDRIKSARYKLSGINPCVITREDLLSGIHRDSKCVKQILSVALGQNAVDENGLFLMMRTRLLKEKKENYHLTVEEQVKCIIEQSTDPDILGRSWQGWDPFI